MSVGRRPLYAAPVHRKIGVMGGTFDPIHNGHLVAASEVADRFALDEVLFVPTGQPWQKVEREVSLRRGPLPHDGDRDGVQPALLGEPRRHRPRRPHLHRRHPVRPARRQPDAELFFITGADALAQILSWRDVEQVFRYAHFVGVTRPGYELGDDHLPEGVATLVEVPAMAISSTDCRDARRRRAARSGTWCRTGSSSTSPSAICCRDAAC